MQMNKVLYWVRERVCKITSSCRFFHGTRHCGRKKMSSSASAFLRVLGHLSLQQVHFSRRRARWNLSFSMNTVQIFWLDEEEKQFHQNARVSTEKKKRHEEWTKEQPLRRIPFITTLEEEEERWARSIITKMVAKWCVHIYICMLRGKKKMRQNLSKQMRGQNTPRNGIESNPLFDAY